MRWPLVRCRTGRRRTVQQQRQQLTSPPAAGASRWGTAVTSAPSPEPRGQGDIEELVIAAVRAAVVAPETEIVRKWFSWRWLFDDHLVERLVSEGRLERIEPGWVTGPASG